MKKIIYYDIFALEASLMVCIINYEIIIRCKIIFKYIKNIIIIIYITFLPQIIAKIIVLVIYVI